MQEIEREKETECLRSNGTNDQMEQRQVMKKKLEGKVQTYNSKNFL